MAEEKKDKEVKTEVEKKKMQKNMIVLFAIAVLIGAGAYYFMNSNNMSSSTPPQNDSSNNVTQENSTTPTLTSKKWTWVSTKMSDGAVSEPSKPGAFTLTFQEDMRVLATTDCNNGNGSYELGSDNTITFGPMATTMMFCEGSSESVFFQQLNNIGSFTIENNQLWLMIKFDSGTMVFE